MNSKIDFPKKDEYSEEITDYSTASIDDLFKEIEAKEKALHISPEMFIEIDDVDFSDENTPESLKPEIPAVKTDYPKTAAPSDNVPNKSLISNLENKVSNLENQILKLKNERAEIFETARRRGTDFDNYKKRTERERSETFRNQLGNLANRMLPVVDNLDRALDAASVLSNEKTKDFEQFYEGIVMVSQQINEILLEMGVEPILAIGKSFDPHYHEAVATEETGEHSPHTVIEELLRGYRIGEKVIRPSMVKVSSSAK